MGYQQGERLVAVFRSRSEAIAAARAAGEAGVPAVRVGDESDRRAALTAEMHDEVDHTIAGPGNVGPWTFEMSRGMVLGGLVGAAAGLVLALPFAAIGFGGFVAWVRLLVVGVAGALAGGTAGWVVGGGFGARRDDEPLAAERGVTVSAPASEAAERSLAAARPLRLDLVGADGSLVRTLCSEPAEPLLRVLGRHAANEDREG